MKNKILKIIFIIFLFSIPQIKGTNSYFTSTEKKLSVIMTTATDYTAPVSQILTPSDNEDVSGTSILISGNSIDESSVASTKLLYTTFNGSTCDTTYTNITTLINSSFTNPFIWSYSWTPPSSSAAYCIKAEAIDAYGNEENSPVVENVTFNMLVSVEPTPTPTPIVTDTPTPTPAAFDTTTTEPIITQTPTPTPTEEAVPTENPTLTPEPTAEPTATPTAEPTVEPQPTTQPEATPTDVLE